ncbi:hypothetical protein [Amycolatopsis sp.]|uniref:hypothetical protein n=1 Tax=Amycolatopsis sp. TaxID=37632 RepID=UPI002D80B9B6|nr:hypothetical protein [Amycolatopsis sp.]HET6711540.1 hypothetical protein [Amycolatopsis sp.]
MSAPRHDPELFDELMRTELRQQPVSRYAMTPTSASWAGGRHRAVCYYHFAAEKTGPVR